MVKHIVFWTFKDHADGQEKDTNIERVAVALRSLPAHIQEINDFEVGVNSIHTPASFDMALTCTFDSWEDFETYKIHAEHEKVVELVGKVVMDRAVVDFEL
jgi:hypothetical protein